MRVLLVEDDPNISQRLADRLVARGFRPELANDAETALNCADPDRISAMIVDLGLPGMSGLDLVRLWRKRGSNTPILVLSARGSWQEKVDGLNAGCDDYVVKPVHSEEIAARLHALIRRAAGQSDSHLSAGKLSLDPAGKMAWLDGERLELTQTEFRLLRFLMLRAGQTLSQAEIHDHLYPSIGDRDLNTVEVHVGRLRRKIGRASVRTLRGLGYRLEP